MNNATREAMKAVVNALEALQAESEDDQDTEPLAATAIRFPDPTDPQEVADFLTKMTIGGLHIPTFRQRSEYSPGDVVRFTNRGTGVTKLYVANTSGECDGDPATHDICWIAVG